MIQAFVTQLSSRVASVADFAAVNTDIQQYLRPLLTSMIGLAGVVATFFIIVGGIEYMTSSGKPERLEHAKRVLRNALIGLLIVIAAGTLTAILSGAYQDSGGSGLESIPSLTPVEVDNDGGGVTELLISSIVGMFKKIIITSATPFLTALDYFTQSTPLMADNPAVFKLWLTVLGMANALFVLVVALLGFQVMSAASLGIDEIEFKHLLPKLTATFLLMNISLFAIDALIALSNVMVGAVRSAYDNISVFDALKGVVDGADAYGLVSLLVIIVFLILSVMLLVYYVTRIVALYVGAIMSPVVAMLQIVPGFKDFTATATKTYVVNVFVLFVHAVILTLVATLFAGIRTENVDQPFDPVMATIIGVAGLLALLKTQSAIQQISYVSTGPRAMRRMSKEFINGAGTVVGAANWGRKKVMGNKQPEDTVTPRNGGPPENKYRSMPRLSSVPKVSNNMREL